MTPTTVYDALVLGYGPAGITASLVLSRHFRSIAILSSAATHPHRNLAASHMHMIPTRDHIDPREFRRLAREELLTRYGAAGKIDFVDDAALASVAKVPALYKGTDGFMVKDQKGREFLGRKIIVATGSIDKMPDLTGFSECWGKTLFHCPFCHGFEQRGSSASGVLLVDHNEKMLPMMAFSLAFACRFHANQAGNPPVTFFLNGAPDAYVKALEELPLFQAAVKKGIKVDNRKVTSLELVESGKQLNEGDEGYEMRVTLEGGEVPLTVKYLLCHAPTALSEGSTLVAKDLGLSLNAMGDIEVSDFNESNVKGVFVAGDAMTKMKAAMQALSLGGGAGAGAAMALATEDLMASS